MEIKENKFINQKNDTKNLPTISIITPCYNHAEFIEAAILSVINQGYPKLEYIIMDGGSTDGSVEIIKKYEPYLKHWQSQKDNGQYEAINNGFKHTIGEIMGWLNSDDMLHRNALWTIADIFQQLPEVNWLLGQHTKYNTCGECYSVNNAPLWSQNKVLRGEWQWIQQESTFWHSELWKKAGGQLNNNFQYAADFDLWARFFRHAQLYTTSSLIGGFRTSSQDQKGRKFREQYILDVNQIVAREQKLFKSKLLSAKNR